MSFFQNIEVIARKGAEGLDPEARQEIVQAILRRSAPDGGQMDLSEKQSDPYYSFFAWLCLRALMDSPPDALEEYFKTCVCRNPVDRYCKTFVRLLGLPAFKRKLACLAFSLRHPPHDPYTILLCGLLADISFPQLSPLVFRRIRLYHKQALSTSRLAAQLLANPTAAKRHILREALLKRHVSTGGFSSAENCPPDLLATAAARVALLDCRLENRDDLTFAESCWAPDGLFASHPGASKGDVEHTFYALLVFGTCRA